MDAYLSFEALSALASVVAIDVALAGDNAIVVGMAAAGLRADIRRKAIMIGILAAAVLRIVFALFTVQLLQVVGLTAAGGVLLLWVSWKLWREAREGGHEEESGDEALSGDGAANRPQKTFVQAVTQIVIADVSMSLDNVLAVAGAAREHMGVLVIGLSLSVLLMGLAATFIARLLRKHPWIVYIGLAIILYVAVRMIWDGSHEVAQAVSMLK